MVHTALADGPYVRVDLPLGPLPTEGGIEQGFFELRAPGYKPSLAHPERHRELATSPEKVERLHHQDLLFQVDPGSFTGRFGRRAQATAEMFLQMGCIEFVGSDGHDLEKRPVSLQNARRLITAACGPLEAHRLFCDNPTKVVKGEPVEPRSEGASISAPSVKETASTSTWKRTSRVFTGKA